jgi:hypothetical protein
MFKNGPDVGLAVDAGREAVTDTVGAVWGGAKDGAEEVGDFVDDIF